jgi:HD-GYP domain-containing protein (c-di-GMP phosphodiesterase class II)
VTTPTKIKVFRPTVVRHLEPIVVVTIFLGVLLMNSLAVQRASFLNFYYLPVLITGLFLGLRASLLASLLSVGFVSLFQAIDPARFSLGATPTDAWGTIALWGCFLVLTSLVVGVLQERNRDRHAQLRQAYVGTLEILTKYLESNDEVVLGHSTRVSRLAEEVARRMGLPEDRIENCRVAGLLHDVGRIRLAGDSGDNRAGLNEAEREALEPYAQRGARMIDALGDMFRDVVPIIEYHQDPYAEEGRINEDVPLEAQIVAAADTFDQIVSGGPRRPGSPPRIALAELEKWSGSQYAPVVVATVKRVVPDTAATGATAH